MLFDHLIPYITALTLVLCVIFVVVFVIILKSFDDKICTYLLNIVDRSMLLENQLKIYSDIVLLLIAIAKPECTNILSNTKISKINSSLLRDIYKCYHIHNNICKNDICCCRCAHSREVYVLEFDENVKLINYTCTVGDIFILIQQHGTCPLHETKINVL